MLVKGGEYHGKYHLDFNFTIFTKVWQGLSVKGAPSPCVWRRPQYKIYLDLIFERTWIKLVEGNLITTKLRYASNNLQIYSVNLTYQGHEYLNNIRDNKIWKNTKKISSKLSSVSLEILKSIAINEINKVIGS